MKSNDMVTLGPNNCMAREHEVQTHAVQTPFHAVIDSVPPTSVGSLTKVHKFHEDVYEVAGSFSS